MCTPDDTGTPHTHTHARRQVTENATAWVANWARLAKDVADDPVLRPVVLFDILNEPDSKGLTCARVRVCCCALRVCHAVLVSACAHAACV